MGMIYELFAVRPDEADRLRADPSTIHALLDGRGGTGAHLSLEKAWGGLHFALTGTAFDGEPPLNLLMAAGEPVGGEDLGYGPARLFAPTTVAAFAHGLASFTEADFDRNFVPARMAAEGTVYPDIWDEPPDVLRDEYLGYLGQLKAYVARAAAAGDALVAVIG